VEVIDLTDETFLATVTDIVGVGVDSTKLDGGDKATAPESLEKSLTRRKWEIIMGIGERKAGRWRWKGIGLSHVKPLVNKPWREIAGSIALDITFTLPRREAAKEYH
jgi:hypothetical protein